MSATLSVSCPPADRKKVAPVDGKKVAPERRTIGLRSLAFHKQQGARLKLRLTYVCADTCLRGLLTEAPAKHKVNRKVGQPSDSKMGSPCRSANLGKCALGIHWRRRDPAQASRGKSNKDARRKLRRQKELAWF